MRGLTLALTLALTLTLTLTLPLTLTLTPTLILTLALTSALTRCEVALGSCVWPPTEPIFDARVRWLSECDGEGGSEEDDSGDEGGGEGEGEGEGEGGEGEGGCSVVALEGAAALGPLVTEWQAVSTQCTAVQMHIRMHIHTHMRMHRQCCWPSLHAHHPHWSSRPLTSSLTKLHIIQALVVSGERERSPGQLTRILNDLGAHLATLT